MDEKGVLGNPRRGSFDMKQVADRSFANRKPRILFRCDVSQRVGTGHLRRCLVLASELKAQGSFVSFVVRTEDFDLSKELSQIPDDWSVMSWLLSPEADAQEVVRLCRDNHIDILILDHYRVDAKYQMAILESGLQWLQFAYSSQEPVPLWSDWVLNFSLAAKRGFYARIAQRQDTKLLLGPSYALLRPDFRRWRSQTKIQRHVHRILFMFGGGNDNGATVFCLEALKSLGSELELIFLVSSCNPQLHTIMKCVERYEGNSPLTLLIDEHEVGRHMSQSDLAVIAGGTASFETAAMGLPCLIIQTAENQKLNAAAWERANTAVDLGQIQNLTHHILLSSVLRLIDDPHSRQSMSRAGKALVDGLGAERVARSLLYNEYSI